MASDPIHAADVLNRRFFTDYPLDAARKIEELAPAGIVPVLSRQPVQILAPVWRRLLPATAASLLAKFPAELADRLVAELQPSEAARILAQMPDDDRQALLARLDPAISADLETIFSYPPGTAGRMMNPAIVTFRREMTVGQALRRLRERGMLTARSLFLVDEDHRLVGKVSLQEVVLATTDTVLGSLERPITKVVRPVAPLEEVSAAFETYRLLDLPVVDLEGVFLGAVTHEDLAQSVQEDATADIQTMVGASKEERALSNPLFTVRRRMPWLQINLLTAFLAAAVVGVFEQTIAQVTALAVLLPVVAEQSGNAGAQALAVTMRGLALREITVRQGMRVMRKDVIVGFVNGLGIALTCGIGVYVWSQSAGMVAVICVSMVLAMVAAGFAGALIPIVLTRLGQDPATSSSIILTTVTDVAGFFSFLGIATVMMSFL
jgi:magnesium transporter